MGCVAVLSDVLHLPVTGNFAYMLIFTSVLEAGA
jgi:hypothetical protein